MATLIVGKNGDANYIYVITTTSSFSNIRCLLLAQHLIELSLDGNPLSESDPAGYR